MSVEGTWNVKMETPMGTREAVLALDASGGSLHGKMEAPDGTIDIYDGAVSGNNLSWKANVTSPMTLTLEFSAIVEGDSMTGTVKLGMFGDAPLSGTRG